jgi:malate dehydrogenase
MFAARTLSTRIAGATTASVSSATAAAAARGMSTKVAVLGASGGIGQPLSMLLKLSPEIDELACYDIVGTPGVAADLSHVRWFLFM